MAITDELIRQTLFESQPLHSSSALHLERGDMIVSIDGRPISFFASFFDIVDYMKKTTTLFLVTLRHQQAQEAALTVLNHGKGSRGIRDFSHHVSNTASLECTLPLLYNASNDASQLFQYRRAKPAFYGQGLCHEPSRTLNAKKNKWFLDENGIPVSFDDDVQIDLEDGSRACIVSFWSD